VSSKGCRGPGSCSPFRFDPKGRSQQVPVGRGAPVRRIGGGYFGPYEDLSQIGVDLLQQNGQSDELRAEDAPWIRRRLPVRRRG
jgi:hypothetical protein